jgi:uncharacterized small protein (DUF1192 family)
MGLQKTNVNNILANLKGRKWNGRDAAEYLYDRLEGEDGEPAWSLAEASRRLQGKLRRRVTDSVISKWLKEEKAKRRARDDYEFVLNSTLAFFKDRESSLTELEQIADCTVVQMIARTLKEEGVEEAVKVINAMTSFLNALTNRSALRQRSTEWTERTAKLKAELEALRKKLNKPGGSTNPSDHIDQVVGLVDQVMGLAR